MQTDELIAQLSPAGAGEDRRVARLLWRRPDGMQARSWYDVDAASARDMATAILSFGMWTKLPIPSPLPRSVSGWWNGRPARGRHDPPHQLLALPVWPSPVLAILQMSARAWTCPGWSWAIPAGLRLPGDPDRLPTLAATSGRCAAGPTRRPWRGWSRIVRRRGGRFCLFFHCTEVPPLYRPLVQPGIALTTAIGAFWAAICCAW